jgi:tetratricopeptide (TPR) repeat protein
VREISERDVFVVVLSPDAMASHWVRDDINLAWRQRHPPRRKLIVPVRHRAVELPPNLEMLATLHMVSFVPPVSYETALAGLLRAIREGGAREDALHAPPPSAAPFDEALLPRPPHFVGRAHDLQAVIDRLSRGVSAAITGVAALRGQPGIGKTPLAAQAVHVLLAQGRFPDGVAVVLAQSQQDALALLRQALARFDPGNTLQLDQLDAAGLATAAHRLLDGKDALIVLDNLEPDVAARDLLDPLAATGVTLLVTARQHISPLAPEATVSLDLLPPEEALDLFAVTYRGQPAEGRPADALAAEERAVAARIVEELARHTLAVKQAGAYAHSTGRALAIVAGELRNPQRALTLRVPDAPEAVITVFETSYRALDPDAELLFAALAAFAPPELTQEIATELRLALAPEFGRQAALALGRGLALADPEAAVDLLVARALADASTINTMPEGSDRERLRLHPLIQAFAQSLFTAAPPEGEWTEDQRQAAYQALAEHYADYTGSVPYLALAPDEVNIAGALEWAHAHSQDELLAAICDGMHEFWRNTGRTTAALRYLRWGMEIGAASASATGDRQTRRRMENLSFTYAQILQNMGRLDEAQKVFEQNLAYCREVQDRRGEGVVLGSLGSVAQARGRLEEAEGYFQQSLAIYREVQARRGEAVNIAWLGQIAMDLARLEEAERLFLEALLISREVQDQSEVGGRLYNLVSLQDR